MHKFLQSGNFPKTELAELSYSPKVATLSLATMLAERLFNDPDLQPIINEDMNENQVELISTASGSPSLVQQLQKSISEMLHVPKACGKANKDSFVSSFQNELKMFSVTKIKSTTIQNLLNALESIQPTSTESERVFSIAGNFCTKLRSSMKFDLLDASS